ncbi:MAG: RHS repeat protein, partial [Acholeplasmatales bacterium]|nr:RHS repeat protein [Acholeplasmatales bacterium]
MKNIGIRSFSKNLERNLTFAKAYINLSKNENNIIIDIPLLNEFGLSYIYNNLNREKTGSMGKGGQISIFKKLNTSDLTIENADGSIDKYVEGVENKLTGLTLTSASIDRYNLKTNYNLKTKDGNLIEYGDTVRDYPEIIKTNNVTNTITLNSDGIIIQNQSKDEAFLKINGKGIIEEIALKKDSKLIQTVLLHYDNEKLTEIEYVNPRGGKNSVLIRHDAYSVSVICKETNEGEKYIFRQGLLVEVDIIDKKETKKDVRITYDETLNATTIEDSTGTKEYYLFNSRKIQNLEFDVNTVYTNDLGDITANEYNDELKLLYSNGYDKVKLQNAVISNLNLSDFNIERGDYTAANEYEEKVLINASKTNKQFKGLKSISLLGNGTDNYLFTCLVKGNENGEIKATLTSKIQGQYVESIKSSPLNLSKDLRMLSVCLNATKAFDTLDITLEGNGNLVIGSINLFKTEFASFYQYDEHGNRTGVQNGGKATYNSKNLVSNVVGDNCASYDFTYDSNNNMKSCKGAYGIKIENEYDKFNNVVKQTVSSDSVKLVTTKEYDESTNLLKSETDESGNVTTYEYDDFGEVKKIKNALGHICENVYNKYSDLEELIVSGTGKEARAKYHYDEETRKLIEIDVSNGTIYRFVYDEKLRLTKLLLNGTCVFKYVYNDLDLISSQYFGESSDHFDFEYNDKKIITKISYSDQKLYYIYIYDDFNRLHKIEEYREGKLYTVEEYKYDSDSKVIKVINKNKEISKIFDNLGNVSRTKSSFPSKKIIQEYDTIDRAKGSNPETILSYFGQNASTYCATFIKDINAYTASRGISGIAWNKHCRTIEAKDLAKDGIIPCVDSRIGYSLSIGNTGMPKTCGYAAFWFKPSIYENNVCLFSMLGKYNDVISVFAYDGYLYLKLKNRRSINDRPSCECGPNDAYLLYKSKEKYNINEWNFFAIDIYTRFDEGCDFVFDIAFYLNSDRQRVYYKNDWKYDNEITNDVVYNFGFYTFSYDEYSQIGNTDYNMSMKLALVSVYDRYIPEYEIEDYYENTKDYIVDNALPTGVNDFNAVDFSRSSIYDVVPSFKVFPLENNLFSLDYDPTNVSLLDKPYHFDIRKGVGVDKDRTFNFNNVSKRYAYVANKGFLSYKTNFDETGTFAAKFFVDSVNDKQYLFDFKGEHQNFSLYRNINKELILFFNNHEFRTGLILENNKWTGVAISYDVAVEADSASYMRPRFFRIVCGSKEAAVEAGDIYGYGLNNVEVLLGRSFKEETVNTNMTHGLVICHALYGQIADFAYKNKFSNYSECMEMLNVNFVSKLKMYDELNILRREEINKNNNTIYSHQINYTNDKGLKISSDSFKFASNSSLASGINYRNYEIDDTG